VSELLLVIGVGAPALALLLSPRTSDHRFGSKAGSRSQQAGPVVPTGPQRRVDTAVPKVEGRLIRVASDKELQGALDQARPGDELVLKAGAPFYGSFVLPRKNATGDRQVPKWITITSDLPAANLVEPGVRVFPGKAAQFPKLESTTAEPALRAAPGAAAYRLIGIEMTIVPSVKINYGIVRLGEGTESSVEQLPHDIIIDRCYIHGLPASNVRRGIALNCASSAVIDSWISDCHEAGADSQAICCWNGSGPFEISNNYLEAAGENMMFGGADPGITGLIPSDITFTRNYCRKPLSWRGADPQRSETRWSVKNLFELKNAERVLIENNVFDNNWVDAQTGYAILFKSVNQDGKAPWSVTRDVIFRGNLVRHVSSGLNIEGSDPHNQSGRTALVLIENNLFEDINSSRWGGEGAFIKITAAEDIQIDHNTALGNGSIIVAYGEATERFVFTNNVVCNNAYGIKGDGTATGTPTLDKFFKIYRVSGNAIMGGAASSYPPGNCYPPHPATLSTQAALGASGRCSPADGQAVGCDFNVATVLDAAGTAELESGK
jgi:hypothetical protein